jgi:Ca2+-binding RTX toxin-like protein
MPEMTLVGTDQDDMLVGAEGNDTLIGLGGNDILQGGAGTDLLDGGTGADTYRFSRGDGRDTIYSFPDGQQDRLQIGAGIDMTTLAVRAEGSDLLLAVAGSGDSIRIANYFNVGPQERMRIEFADGAVWDGMAVDRKLMAYDDFLAGMPGQNDTLDGGLGHDHLFGADGDDILYGDAGNDMLDGGPGADTYVFGRGDGRDVILAFPDGQQDRLRLGQGIGMADVAVHAEGGDLVVSLTGSSDSVRIANYFNLAPQERLRIEFADGAVWDGVAIDRKLWRTDDFVVGQPGVGETLDGGLGHDVMVGGDGDDILYGDAGNDQMDGGPGSDTYLFGRGDGHDTIVAFPDPQQPDRLRLGQGIGMADLSARNDGGDLVLALDGRPGDSVRISNYFGMAPQDRLRIEFADGAVWDGWAVDRKVYPSDDFVYAESAQGQTVDGGAGHDVVVGAEGDDILYGDAGNDTLDGGMGANTYVFGRGDGQDSVFSAYDAQQDRVLLGGGITLADVDVRAEGSDLVLEIIGSSDSLRLVGYLNLGPEDRLRIEFADGAAWDGTAIDRKLWSTDEFLGGQPGLNETLDGGAGHDFLHGGDGDDTLYGDTGNDLMDGGPGADTYLFGRGDGHDTIVAVPDGQQDRLRLGSGITLADVEVSQDGSGLVLTLAGSTGDSVRIDNYFYLAPHDRMRIEFADGAAWDGMAIERKLFATDDFMGGQPGQSETLDGGAGHDVLVGGDGDDILYGDTGNDVLDGGPGADIYLYGRGDGQDTVVNTGFDGQQDVLRLGSGIGLQDVALQIEGTDLLLALAGSTDTLRLTGYFQAPVQDRVRIEFADGRVWDGLAVEHKLAEVNDQLYGGSSNDVLDGGRGHDVLVGLEGDDLLIGDAGDDLLEGGAGADQLHGGQGNDAYWAVDEFDTVVEHANEGHDAVYVFGSYTLGDHLEALTLLGTGPASGTGNALNNIISGNDGDNHLDGHEGADDLFGGRGSDTYVVDDLGDRVIERDGEGIDSVVTSVTFALGTGVENLTLVGPAAGAAHGNALNNTIVGSEAANFIDGMAGSDTMLGGAGDDTYVVDALSDQVIEFAGEGLQDTVHSSVNWVLSAQVENLTLLGTANLYGSGNAQNNILVGNSGANRLVGNAGNDWLDGQGGSDTLQGGLGDDTYVIDRSTDVVVESSGQGNDTVFSSVSYTLASALENLSLTGSLSLTGAGNSAANVLIGNAGNNVLSGYGGMDQLDGGAGMDTLAGGTGADTYVFARGHGTDTVQENDSTYGVRDSVQFGPGVVQSDMAYVRSGNDLVAAIRGTSDKLVFQNWYQGSRCQVEDFRFSDGSVLTNTQVQRLVGAMATFSATSSSSDAGMSSGPDRSATVQLVPNVMV